MSPFTTRRCLYCKHEWFPRQPTRTRQCPSCGRRDWDVRGGTRRHASAATIVRRPRLRK